MSREAGIMLHLKSCPRCRGDLYEESDHHGVYIGCCQCGAELSPEQEQTLRMNVQRKLAQAHEDQEAAIA